MTRISTGRMFFLSLGALIFIRPHPAFLGDAASTYLADSLIGLILLFRMLGTRRVPRLAGEILLPTLLLLSILFANLFRGSFVLGHLDFVFPLKLLLYSGVAYYIYQEVLCLEVNSRTLIVFYYAFFFINIAIVLLQLFNLPIFTSVVHEVWGTVKLRGFGSSNVRVYGAFANANWFGVYVGMSLLGAVAFYSLRQISINSFWSIMLFGSLGLLVSGSRSGVLALIIGLGLMLIILIQKRRIWCIVILGIIGSTLIVPLVFNIDQLTGTIDRFSSIVSDEGVDFGQVNSFTGRIASWSDTLAAINSPADWLFGSARQFSEAENRIVTHNGFIRLLYSYGLIPFIVCSYYILFLSWRLYVIFRSARQGVVSAFGIWGVAATALFVAANFSGDFIFSTQLVLSYIFLTAIAFALYQRERFGQWL